VIAAAGGHGHKPADEQIDQTETVIIRGHISHLRFGYLLVLFRTMSRLPLLVRLQNQSGHRRVLWCIKPRLSSLNPETANTLMMASRTCCLG
jgi:hypothetical protein